jgi:NADH-quinone oxidoreductase subunit M
MIPVLLIAIPLITGIAGFFIKRDAKTWALLSSLVTLAVILFAVCANTCGCNLSFNKPWLPELGADFNVSVADGMGKMLCLLTGFAFPLIFAATANRTYKNESSFYALMLLAQAGLMGVFVSMDALLFYFFWELALIPVYFLCSRWGGERRIAATFKFFIYTFAGSVLMLIAILYLFSKTPDNSFAWQSFSKLSLSASEQNWVFAAFFIAFAIKMPVFPFHTWQPDAYEQAPTATTMVLSGVMVKMGLFGVIRWLLPVAPGAASVASTAIMVFSIIGIIYASLIAMRQDDLKRLVAYSSIAHIGLMCAAIFSGQAEGLQGVMAQMFNHGINIIGLWIVIEIIERQTGIRKMSQLGGLARTAPALAIFLVVIALANVALPLTNAFAGEFLMFTAVFKYNVWMAVFAGLGIILAAVYTLNMIQKVFLGEASAPASSFKDISMAEKTVLTIIVLFILVMGVYSTPMFDMTRNTVMGIIK